MKFIHLCNQATISTPPTFSLQNKLQPNSANPYIKYQQAYEMGGEDKYTHRRTKITTHISNGFIQVAA